MAGDQINTSLYDEALIVCANRNDLPVPNVPSEPGACVHCSVPVWVSFSILAQVPDDLPVAYICPACYIEAEAMAILEGE